MNVERRREEDTFYWTFSDVSKAKEDRGMMGNHWRTSLTQNELNIFVINTHNYNISRKY